MDLFMGIDVGSQQSKGVILEDETLLASLTLPSGVNHRETAEKLRERLLAELNRPAAVTYCVSTGCGAENVPYADERVYDIQCSARGIHHFSGSVRTLIEVGARSTRVIKVNQAGKVIKFAVTDKCAAGSGVFLQIVANVLRIGLEEVGPLSLKSTAPVIFNTGCAVFGETEAITRVCEGIPKEDILAGVHKSIAEKIYASIVKVGLEEECALAGGGGLDRGFVKRLEEKIGLGLVVPPRPEIICALGAAVSARQKYLSRQPDLSTARESIPDHS